MICDHFECASLFEKCKRFIGRSRPLSSLGEEVCKDCPNAICKHCSHFWLCRSKPDFFWRGDFEWLK